MSANLKPKTSTARIWLRDAAEQLAAAGIGSALLDAEIILAHTLRKSRTWLHAYDETALSARELEIANARLDLRLDRTPIAYIIGHKEFYGRTFRVTPAVLIPRPESEPMIALLEPLYDGSPKTLVDVGTGSGCLGITAKLEYPELDVTLTDISKHALTVAERNAAMLGAEVTTTTNNLLSPNPALPQSIDIILANLPYVDASWERSPETAHEPETALFADNDGLALIYELIDQSSRYLAPGGHILLEADPRQHHGIIEYAKNHGLRYIATDGFIVVLRASAR